MEEQSIWRYAVENYSILVGFDSLIENIPSFRHRRNPFFEIKNIYIKFRYLRRKIRLLFDSIKLMYFRRFLAMSIKFFWCTYIIFVLPGDPKKNHWWLYPLLFYTAYLRQLPLFWPALQAIIMGKSCSSKLTLYSTRSSPPKINVPLFWNRKRNFLWVKESYFEKEAKPNCYTELLKISGKRRFAQVLLLVP